MKWIGNEFEFATVLLEARHAVFIDSARVPTTLARLAFDDAMLLTRRFAGLLQNLLRRSGDQWVSYLVLNPDPMNYYHEQFGSYPLIKLGLGISDSEYLELLNENPEHSPVDALGVNWSEAVLVPPSKEWFVHMLRSAEDNGGHLWIPSEWLENLLNEHPFLRVPQVL